MNPMTPLTSRRHFLKHNLVGMAACGLALGSKSACAAVETQRKKVAAVVTIYRYNSHSDVILGKILEGWKQDGGPGPNLELTSLYVDQFPDDDMSRKLSTKYGFPIYSNIRDCLTLGTDQIAVDGVISIGEHGDYPWNEKQQHLYPRKRFFEEITDTFSACGKVVPVFNDKHPGPQWDDALWMYRRAQELKLPWMAGSSLPVSYRSPDVTLPWLEQVDQCLAVGYSGLDIYGFHTLDFLQAIIERRNETEKGVSSVQALPVTTLTKLIQEGVIHTDLLNQALAASRTDLKTVTSMPPTDGAIFVIEYLDGLKVPVLMLSGIANGISVALKTKKGKTFATRTEERPDPRHPHFAYLLKGIEKMIHTGKPTYPVERSVLTAGILDRALTSLHQKHTKLETPELAISYKPVDYPYAPHIDL